MKRETTVGSLAVGLERVAMTGLTVLGVTVALESVHPILSLCGLVLTNVELLLLLVAVWWIGARAAGRRRPSVPHTVALPAIAWLAALLTSALLAPSHRIEALKFSARMTAGVLVAWVSYDLLRTDTRYERLGRALAAGGLLVGVLGVVEAMDPPGAGKILAVFKQDVTVVGEVLRVSSTLGYATIASMMLELSVPLLVAWMLTTKRRGWRIGLGAGLIVTLVAQMLTLTRGGLIALVAALVFMAGWAAWRRRRTVLMGSLATVTVLLALWGTTLIWNPVMKYRLISETAEDWYQAAYEVPPRVTADAGETVRVAVRVRNMGVRKWQAKGDHPFKLSYHMVRRGGPVIQFEGRRASLPHDLPSGGCVELRAAVAAPRAAGEYVILWDMMQEEVTWFSWEGIVPGRTTLVVGGATAGGAAALEGWEGMGSEEALLIHPAREKEGRLWLWRVAADMVEERPFFGVGPDNFRWLHGTYAGVEDADERVHANNLYVEWLVDTGVVGFAAFLWLTWSLVRGVYATLDDDEDGGSNAVWHAAVAASLVAWFVHGVVDSFYAFTPTYVTFAMVCGLALASSPLTYQGGRRCASDSM